MFDVWNEAVRSLGNFHQMKYLAPAITLAFFWCWESMRPFFGIRSGRVLHAARNLGIMLVNSAILSLSLGVATVLTAYWTEKNHIGLLFVAGLTEPVRGVIALVTLDAWMYLWHRANHTLPFLWRFHRMHHSDIHMDVTTAARFHLGEQLLSATLRLGLIPLLGIAVWHVVIYDLLVVAFTQFHHADISIGWLDRWLRSLIVTPFMHKVHHSRLKVETDSNYSVILSLWDRLAGTFQMRFDPKTIEFGVDEFDSTQSQTILGMLKTPFVSFQNDRLLARETHKQSDA